MFSPSSQSYSKSELHDGIEKWNVTDRIKIIVHMLVDLGHVTSLECTYPNCGMPTREFGEKRMRPAIDHKLSRRNGGSNRAKNLQVIHLGCNARKARFEDAGVPIDEFMARVRAKNDYEWQRNASEFHKAQWTEARRREQSERMKTEWADPEIRAQKLKVHGNAYKRRKDAL